MMDMAGREIIEMLKRYVVLLNSEGISVSRAYLFGSYSTGTATEQSDIDTMIVSDKFDSNDDAAVEKVWRLTRKVSTRIEPYLISTKKIYHNNTSLLINSINDYSIELVEVLKTLILDKFVCNVTIIKVNIESPPCLPTGRLIFRRGGGGKFNNMQTHYFGFH